MGYGYGATRYGKGPWGADISKFVIGYLQAQQPVPDSTGNPRRPTYIIRVYVEAFDIRLFNLQVGGVTIVNAGVPLDGWVLTYSRIGDYTRVTVFPAYPKLIPMLPPLTAIPVFCRYVNLLLNYSFTTRGPFLVSKIRQISHNQFWLCFNEVPAETFSLYNPASYAFEDASGLRSRPQVGRVSYPYDNGETDPAATVLLTVTQRVLQHRLLLVRVTDVVNALGEEVG